MENMQLNKLNNIIFLKNVESNVIEEAFIVLKENVKLHNIQDDKKSNECGNINVLKEAELLVNKKIDEANIEYEKFKIRKLEKRLKILKVVNIILIALSIVCIKLF